jgi:membrane protease YdiL (CAAX protease family)
MSNLENTNLRAPGPTLPPRTWDFFETTLVALIAYGVFVLAGWIAVDFAFNAYGAIEGYSPAELRGAWLKYQEGWGGFYYIGGALPGIAVLSTAIHMAGREFEEYLALKWPAPREAVRAFGIFAIVLAGEGLVAHFAGAKSCAPASGLVVGGPSGLMIMLIGSCIAVPVFEEFIVRGFMFRGWSESFLGPVGAIVLTSAAWAMNHTQYGWFGRLEIFGMGLALGYSRWRSASTWLTVMMHSALNTAVFFMKGPYV